MPQVNQQLSVSSRVTVFETGPRHFMRPSTVSRNLAGKTINSLLPLSAVQYIDIYQGQFEDFRLLQLLNTSTYQFQSLRCSDISASDPLLAWNGSLPERSMSNTSKSSNLLEVSWNPTIVNSKAKQQSTNINKHTQRIVTLKGRWLESLFAWHRGVCDFRIIEAFQQFIVVEQPGIKSSLCDDAAWTSADSHNTHVRPVPCNKCGPASLAQRFKGQSSMWRNQLPRYDPWLSWSWGKTRPGSPMSNTFHWRELLGIIIMQVASASPDYSSVYIYIYTVYIIKNYMHDMILNYTLYFIFVVKMWNLNFAVKELASNLTNTWYTMSIQCHHICNPNVRLHRPSKSCLRSLGSAESKSK